MPLTGMISQEYGVDPAVFRMAQRAMLCAMA